MNAFLDYYRLVGPGVYEYLLCLTGDTEVAETLLKETFLLTHQLMMYLKKAPHLFIWTFSQAKKRYENYLQSPKNPEPKPVVKSKEKERSKIKTKKNIKKETEPEPAKPLEGVSEEWLQLRNAVMRLENPVLHQVMALILFGGQGFKEVSMIMGKTETWTKMSYYRGKMLMLEGDVRP
jgi:RNA polymerase sigma-70 factor (ECF subfamily)